MKKLFLLGLVCAFALVSQAQKKLTPVTQSALTGIGLPKDSKQDSRMLSVAAAATLLEMESDKVNTKVQNTEVLVLPPVSVNTFTRDSLNKRINLSGWKTIATEDDNFVWLQKDNRFVIAHFSTNIKQTDLYLAEATSTPDFAVAVNNASGNSVAPLPVTETQSVTQPQQNYSTNANSSILGIWTMSLSDQSSWRVNNGVMNYIVRQYTLDENGTYTFITKTFDPLMTNLLLGKESGTFQISGNNLTIIPQKSVLEAWSKKDGRDQWGTMLSTQNIELEKVTYQFTRYYMSGIQEWNLVLQAPAPTKLEGPFSSNSSFSNAYYYSTISTSHPIIELPVADKISPAQQTVTNNNSPIVGTWRRGTSVTMYGGRWSSTGYQYIFNANGTYTYVIKTYVEDDPETLLTRESGIFKVSGNTITLDPKTNVIEAWSKSNGGDNYKALNTTQKRPLEKTAYQFTIQFIPELKETGLILLYGNETARDGKYNSIASFPNGWRFSPAGADYKPIKLPGE